jgi:NADH-quinone oxidoreductase subunit M
MADWLTTILILVPMAGALLVALLPLRPFAAGSLAALVSFVEVGFWITAVGKFHFGDPSLQLAQRTSWFGDLHVSYHVGQYAFSLWLVGLTTVVMAACIVYGW